MFLWLDMSVSCWGGMPFGPRFPLKNVRKFSEKKSESQYFGIKINKLLEKSSGRINFFVGKESNIELIQD